MSPDEGTAAEEDIDNPLTTEASIDPAGSNVSADEVLDLNERVSDCGIVAASRLLPGLLVGQTWVPLQQIVPKAMMDPVSFWGVAAGSRAHSHYDTVGCEPEMSCFVRRYWWTPIVRSLESNDAAEVRYAPDKVNCCALSSKCDGVTQFRSLAERAEFDLNFRYVRDAECNRLTAGYYLRPLPGWCGAASPCCCANMWFTRDSMQLVFAPYVPPKKVDHFVIL